MNGVIPLLPYVFAACVGTTLLLEHYHISPRHRHMWCHRSPFPVDYVQCLVLLSPFVWWKASVQPRTILWLTLSYTKLRKTSVLHSSLHSRHCLAHVFAFLICYRQLSTERKNTEEWQIAQIAFPVRMVGMRLQSIEALIIGECCKDTQYSTEIFYLRNTSKCYKPCLLEVLYRFRKLCIVQKRT
jgi:hypothetical protein